MYKTIYVSLSFIFKKFETRSDQQHLKMQIGEFLNFKKAEK